jgi:hypothetical protein
MDTEVVELETPEISTQHPTAESPLPLQLKDPGMYKSVWKQSQDAVGSWAVQRAVESASSEEERCKVAFALRGRIRDAAQHLHANYVLQKCIMVMHPQSLDFVIAELRTYKGAVCHLSRNKYGCRVVQRVLEYCTPAQVAGFIEDMLSDAITNCCDRYGKYAMQCLVEQGSTSQVNRLCKYLVENVRLLAANGNACSVLCKALSTDHHSAQDALVEAFCSCPGLLTRMSQSKERQFILRRVHEVMGRNRTSSDAAFSLTKDAENKHEEGGGRKRHRGKGGGVKAQNDAELRDLLQSLHVACSRRSSERIRKALQRVDAMISSAAGSSNVLDRALCARDEARFVLRTISADARNA